MSEATLAVPTASETEDDGVARKKLGIAAWLSIGWLGLVTLSAVIAPLLPIDDPINDALYNPPAAGFFTTGHWFGTDDLGRDTLSRVLFGARSSLLIAILSIAFGTIIGGFVGLVAGYIRGKVGTVLASIFDILLAFPPLLLAITLVSVLAPVDETNPPSWGKRVVVVALAVGLVSIPVLARITRANTLTWSQREFVMAAQAQGAKPMRIMIREVLPNVVPSMLSIALLGVANVIIVEGGLALFGLSINPPDPSWGNMVASQVDDLSKTPHVWIVPSIAIFLTVMALNLLGDVVRDRFSVREAAI